MLTTDKGYSKSQVRIFPLEQRHDQMDLDSEYDNNQGCAGKPGTLKYLCTFLL